jgi:putative nucleotidyltransferase with HDIG domain
MKKLIKVHVPSGTFVCDKSKPALLQAFLSSCVGVSAWDPVNRVGGLSHFLLPEPISHCLPEDEAKYASTGLPLFIESLIAQGAALSKLVVTVAGGAFSGTLSHQDIHLDIGGRTAETVKDILSRMRVPVDRWETGGFFTCCLSLNLDDGKADIVPSYAMFPEKAEPPSVPGPSDIEKMVDRIKPIPQVALKIMRMIGEDSYSVKTLAAEVKKDQVISGQVLKYCNSVIFSGKKGIDSIDDALLIIGQNALAKNVTAIAVKNMFASGNLGYSMVKGGLYHHAIGVGVLSEMLAKKTGRTHAFSAYTAGLLHDIGKIALDQFVADSVPMFYRNLLDHQTTGILDLEQRYMGTDHTRVGKILAERWSLPGRITDAITHHHTPETGEGDKGTVETVALANALIHMFHVGPELTFVDHSKFAHLMEKMGLAVSDFPGVVDLIPFKLLTSTPETIL